jgi:anti-sigma factor RsiW
MADGTPAAAGRPSHMTCQELVELVTDYLEGALSREDAARFEEHLATCPGCEVYLEQVLTTIAVTRAVGHATAASVTRSGARANSTENARHQTTAVE